MWNKLLPSWLKKSSSTLWSEINPEKIIVGCPFWHDLSVMMDRPKKIDIECLLNFLENNEFPINFENKHELIYNFNMEKENIHNVYINAFDIIINTLYESWVHKINNIDIIDKSFFQNIYSHSKQEITDTILEEIFKALELQSKSIKPHLINSISAFNILKNKWNRYVAWENLSSVFMMWIETLIDPMITYFRNIAKFDWVYSVWENDKKIIIPKHIYYYATLSQAYWYLLASTLNEIIKIYPWNRIYDENTNTWFTIEVENLFQRNIWSFSYNDFYQQLLWEENIDLFNLIMPLEKNYPCPAIWFFPKMRGICLWIMVEKYWEPSDFTYKK